MTVCDATQEISKQFLFLMCVINAASQKQHELDGFQEHALRSGGASLSSGVRNLRELKAAVAGSMTAADLARRQKDFEHRLFHRANSSRILRFREFIESL